MPALKTFQKGKTNEEALEENEIEELLTKAKELLKKGLSEKDIATTLKIHPYRVKLAIQNGKKYDSKLLLKYISKRFHFHVN